ncbi:MAG: MBL fold metallo-hydrolase [Micromonosporaceae bacterium]
MNGDHVAGAVEITPLVDEGLGNSAYLVDLGDGRALAVDVSLDLRAARQAAVRRRLRISHVVETHLHADFLSGTRQVAAAGNAQVLAPAAGGRVFEHTGLRDGDEVDLGGLRLRALATPGHTYEHMSYLLLDGERPVGVFTGGSLLVGTAARTDLVSPEDTEALARRQYSSLRRLAALPDDVAVWPTHGAGSFCSAPSDAERTSTIGGEKTANPLLREPDEDAFVAALTGSLGSFPPYFLRLAERNRHGPMLVAEPALTPRTVDEVQRRLADGAQLIDVRPIAEFAASHIPGALAIPLRPAFGSWLGWLTPYDRHLIAVRNADQDPAEIAWQTAKIGHVNLSDELAGGMPAWTGAGHAADSTRLAPPAEVDPTQVLDVRQRSEFESGHLPGAVNVELGELPDRAAHLTQTPTLVMCSNGPRAMGAASILERAGHRGLTVLAGGPEDWASATGRRLDTGV